LRVESSFIRKNCKSRKKLQSGIPHTLRDTTSVHKDKHIIHTRTHTYVYIACSVCTCSPKLILRTIKERFERCNYKDVITATYARHTAAAKSSVRDGHSMSVARGSTKVKNEQGPNFKVKLRSVIHMSLWCSSNKT